MDGAAWRDRFKMETSGVDVPLYRLVNQSTEGVYLAAHELDGFFVEPNASATHHVVFSGATGVSLRRGEALEDVVLQIVDQRGRVIGVYDRGSAPVVEISEDVASPGGQIGPTVTVELEAEPFPEAGVIWRRWASAAPIRSGEWMEYPIEVHDSWLHVVQRAWFAAWHSEARRGGGELAVLDGRRIVGEASFFCEVGESLNGVGGYFGSSLDAFLDCLRSSWGTDSLRRVVWKHYAVSRDRVRDEFVSEIIDISSAYDVAVSLE